MRPRGIAFAVLVLLAALATPLLAPGAAAASPAATSAPPIAGNVTGPAIVATSSTATFYLNASGGPAVTNGTFVGTINWTASLAGVNTTGTAVAPENGTITSSTALPVRVVVTTGPVTGTLTLIVKVVSYSSTTNETTNLTRSFRVVVPYVVQATLVAGPYATVLAFTVAVALDGVPVGTVVVPQLAAGATYAFSFRYAATGLSSGYHTFTLSVADAHGLVTFANGLTVESTTFYVAPAPADNSVWYVAGVVAFFGVLFIYATRVAARRRGAARR